MFSSIQNALKTRRHVALTKAIWSGNETFALANLQHALFGPEDRAYLQWEQANIRLAHDANRIPRHLEQEREEIGKIMSADEMRRRDDDIIKMNAFEAAMFTGRADLAASLWALSGPERLQSPSYGESSVLVTLARGGSLELLETLAPTIPQREWEFICHKDGTTAKQALEERGGAFLSVLKKSALNANLPQAPRASAEARF